MKILIQNLFILQLSLIFVCGTGPICFKGYYIVNITRSKCVAFSCQLCLSTVSSNLVFKNTIR